MSPGHLWRDKWTALRGPLSWWAGGAVSAVDRECAEGRCQAVEQDRGHIQERVRHTRLLHYQGAYSFLLFSSLELSDAQSLP